MSNAKKATTEEEQFAELVIAKVQEQAQILLAKHWPEIRELLTDDEEVNLAMKCSIIDRTATAGEHADVDSRIKLTLSFAKKFSDSVESPLPDINQPDMPGMSVVPKE